MPDDLDPAADETSAPPGNGSTLPEISEEDLDTLAILLQEYLSAETFLAKERLVEGNALLRSRAAEAALAGLLAQYDGDDQSMKSLELHLHLLRRVREIGVRAAFVEMRQVVQELADGEAGPDQTTLALVDSIGEFITADDWPTKRRWLDDHPDLLSRQADAAFDSLIRTHTARGENNVVRQLMVHRDLLRACGEIGVEAAFDRMENPPDVLDIIADNTIAVLTDHPSERKAWQETVNHSRIRAAETEDDSMLVLLRAISRLLGDEDPAVIEMPLDGPHRACWQRILDAL